MAACSFASVNVDLCNVSVIAHQTGNGVIPEQPTRRAGPHHTAEHQQDKTGAGLTATDNIQCSAPHHQNTGCCVKVTD